MNCLRFLFLVQEVNQKDDFDLLEWRRIRAEQDQAYQESLKADIAKVSCVLIAVYIIMIFPLSGGVEATTSSS